ncbi:uncharacterized protein LOC115464927 [Microcaecilia unicolor]|uniref:Uncharacterized protein LOC115464927 n=1 Tax=Microcaecilia unicolor TaxID=1415580 RepID=A0A6P7X6D7_9AMPH|nr:uncharacterized protein LOC115464927 [Microcaecilia unicolor]
MHVWWGLFLGSLLLLQLAADGDISCAPTRTVNGQIGEIHFGINSPLSLFSLYFYPKNQKTRSLVLTVDAEGNKAYHNEEFRDRFGFDRWSVSMWKLRTSDAGIYQVIDYEKLCVAAWILTIPDAISPPHGSNSTTVSPILDSTKVQDSLDAGDSSLGARNVVMRIVDVLGAFFFLLLSVVVSLWCLIKKQQNFRAAGNTSALYQNGVREEVQLSI